MIKYQHFALNNIFLSNGYVETHTDDGIEREYEYEEALEQCVRRLVFRKPETLRGWDLRFLRRGLELSQADFGKMVDRDAQTVARWEKSADAIPKFVDLTIRMRFSEQFELGMSLKELLSYVDGVARKLPEKILLKLSGVSWTFDLEPRVKVARSYAQADIPVNLPIGQGAQTTIYVVDFHKHQDIILRSKPEVQFEEGVDPYPSLKNIGSSLQTSQGITNAFRNSTIH
jgi:DNA-binding transcriptional regulator YiaG